jgi:YggT family protein
LPQRGAKVKRNAAECRLALAACGGYLSSEPVQGPTMTSLLQILLLILDVAQFIIIAHIIMSWLINFQVLNLRQPIVAQIWDGLNRILEPVYGRVRSVLPSMGGLDLAPLLVLLAIYGLRIVLINNQAAFY